METLTFDTTVRAPRSLVWETMLGDAGYRQWTAPFCEGSHYTGSWAQGDTIRFLTPSGEGMVAEIVEHRPQEFVCIRHLGSIGPGGVEDTTSEQVRAWAPALETYRFSDTTAGCRVDVSVQTLPAHAAFMRDTFPRALAVLKALCERGGAAGHGTLEASMADATRGRPETFRDEANDDELVHIPADKTAAPVRGLDPPEQAGR